MAQAASLRGNDVVLGVDDTLPSPSVELIDSGGAVITDLSGHTFSATFVDAAGGTLTKVGAAAGSVVTFTLDAADVDEATDLRSFVTITSGEGTYTLPGPRVVVVDFSSLWADPNVVLSMADGDYTINQIVLAVLDAEAVVRAWVTAPIASPVSERVRRATALLAARALTTASTGDTILSETMGDYTVRYGEPTGTGMMIDGEVAELLSPWNKSQSGSVYTGPELAEPAGFTELWVAEG